MKEIFEIIKDIPTVLLPKHPSSFTGDDMAKMPSLKIVGPIPYVFIFPDVLPRTHDFHLMIYIEHLSGLKLIKDFKFNINFYQKLYGIDQRIAVPTDLYQILELKANKSGDVKKKEQVYTWVEQVLIDENAREKA
jgi:hypothetical protein